MKRIILVLAVFLAACAPSSQQPAVYLPVILATATPFIDSSYPTAQAQVAAPNQVAKTVAITTGSGRLRPATAKSFAVWTLLAAARPIPTDRSR